MYTEVDESVLTRATVETTKTSPQISSATPSYSRYTTRTASKFSFSPSAALAAAFMASSSKRHNTTI